MIPRTSRTLHSHARAHREKGARARVEQRACSIRAHEARGGGSDVVVPSDGQATADQRMPPPHTPSLRHTAAHRLETADSKKSISSPLLSSLPHARLPLCGRRHRRRRLLVVERVVVQVSGGPLAVAVGVILIMQPHRLRRERCASRVHDVVAHRVVPFGLELVALRHRALPRHQHVGGARGDARDTLLHLVG